MKKKDAVICDFDGTITKVDSINEFLNRFADKKWLEIEAGWIEGKISTIDAMKQQFGMIKGMTNKKLDEFFESIEIDEHFNNFCKYAEQNNIKVIILSDGFKYFIDRIIKKYKIETEIEIDSKEFKYEKGEFIMNFPNKKSNCKKNAGTCKCYFVEKFKKLYETVYYVGDGPSDYCTADKVDFLFAKNRLSEYCKNKNIPFIYYNDFNEVIKNVRIRTNNR